MQWSGGRRSDNVEEGSSSGYGRPLAIGGTAATVLGIVFYLLTGQSIDLSGSGAGAASSQAPVGNTARRGPTAPPDGRQDPVRDLVSVVLASTEDTWPRVLQAQGVRYQDPKLHLFTGAVESACGFEQSAVGPFYCPGDRKVYLDLSFFRELQKMGAPGDFAEAYVVAHEVGHHVQNLLGITDALAGLRQRTDRRQANALSVLTELQADCFAGVWASHANDQRKLIEPGDTEQGLAAAAAVGDDRLQKQARGYVSPESFTHGSSEQRMSWFKRGLTRGTVEGCDTFGSAGVQLRR